MHTLTHSPQLHSPQLRAYKTTLLLIMNAERNALRQVLKQKRAAISAQLRENVQQQLGQILSSWLQSQTAQSIGAYWPLGSELDLSHFYPAWIKQGKILALPLIDTQLSWPILGHALSFRCWQPGHPLIKGPYNLLQPSATSQEITPEILLIPMLGFTQTGYRLGYGGGYYDRTLAMLKPKPLTIGIGFECTQLSNTDFFPAPHDIPMDWILTEQGLRKAHLAGV